MKSFRLERLVAGTVFWRFFETGLVPAGLSPAVVLIWLVAFLATPGYLLALAAGITFGGSNPATILDRILAPTLLLIVLSMAAMALLALLMWESVYPDRRDARILGVIGLPKRTIVLGRLGAVVAVALTVSVGMNLPSSVVFGLILVGSGAAANPVQAVLGQLMATVCSGLFAFFAVLTAQGGVLAAFGTTTAKRASLALQAALVVGLFQTMRHVADAAENMRLVFDEGAHAAATTFPPTWFLALHSTLTGRPSPAPFSYSALAMGATALVVLLSIAFLAATHSRITRMALENTRPRHSRPSVVSRLLDGVLMSGVAPVPRAIAAFTIWTVTRSRTHLVLLATSWGVALALVSPAIAAVFDGNGSASSQAPATALLSVPLILNFILLCCGRALIAVPLEMQANWVFRSVADSRSISAIIGGARTGLMLLVVLPTTAVAAVSLSKWGVVVAVGHAVFTAVMGTLLLDVLLVRHRTVPFASPYRPNGARLGSLWPLYVTAFGLYGYSLARVELWLLSRPLAWCAVVGASLATSWLLARLRRSDLGPPRQLEYDAPDPDELFQGFGLSEGLAALGANHGGTSRSKAGA